MKTLARIVMTLCITMLMLIRCTHQININSVTHRVNSPEVIANVFLSDEFNSQQALTIKDGVDLWSYTSRGIMMWTSSPILWEKIVKSLGTKSTSGRCVDTVLILPIDPTNKLILSSDEELEKYTLGITYYRECSLSVVFLVVDRLKDKRDLKMVAAHEFGHALGLAVDHHLSNEHSVLYKLYNKKVTPECLTINDMELFCDKYDCDVNDTLACVPNTQ